MLRFSFYDRNKMNKKYPEKPSIEFLKELEERARRVLSCDCDYIEVSRFVEEMYCQAGVEDFEMPPSYEEKPDGNS